MTNGFQSSIRRKRIDVDYRDASIADLSKLPIAVDLEADRHIWTRVLRLSDQFDLTIYDACYLELSERHNLPLATLDRALRVASQKLVVHLLGV